MWHNEHHPLYITSLLPYGKNVLGSGSELTAFTHQGCVFCPCLVFCFFFLLYLFSLKESELPLVWSVPFEGLMTHQRCIPVSIPVTARMGFQQPPRLNGWAFVMDRGLLSCLGHNASWLLIGEPHPSLTYFSWALHPVLFLGSRYQHWGNHELSVNNEPAYLKLTVLF